MKYMNKLTLGIVLAAGLFTACSDKDDGAHGTLLRARLRGGGL